MSDNIDWKKVVTDVGEDLGENALEVLRKHSSFLVSLVKSDVIMMLHSVAGGSKEELDSVVYLAMLRSLSDDEFIELRKKTVASVKAWNTLNKKKKEVIDDFTSGIGKMAAETLIRYLIMCAL